MSVYVLLYGIEWHKAKKFSKSQSFAVFGLKIYAKIAASSKPPMPEDLAKSFAKNEKMCNVYSCLMLGKVQIEQTNKTTPSHPCSTLYVLIMLIYDKNSYKTCMGVLVGKGGHPNGPN